MGCDRHPGPAAALTTSRVSTLLVLTAALTACIDDHAREDAAEASPAPPVRLEDDGDHGPARAEDCPAHVPFVASVRARVVDPAGAGVADARVQLCVWTNDGRMLCLEPGRSDAVGDVRIEVAPAARCMVSATARVLLPQSQRPALYCGIELPLDDASVTVADPYLLIEAPGPGSLPPVGDEATPRAVAFEELTVEVTPAAIGTEAYQRLAAVVVPPELAPACLLVGAPAFDALIAFSPEADVAGAGFPFAVDNTLGFEPGAHVELHVQGGLECSLDDGTQVEKGAWHLLGAATVSADGARVEAASATALPCLGWLALRR
ncbi:MAG: hypothetical protein A2138_23260 [Deltaproteobacteria bacterium RBG_16_71_12]|nr:MAG: hypothetical protein A2138_23260 [Deltaproteobacteria bacterium RBG_16_71_12]